MLIFYCFMEKCQLGMSKHLCSHQLVPQTCWATAVFFLKAAGHGLCCESLSRCSGRLGWARGLRWQGEGFFWAVPWWGVSGWLGRNGVFLFLFCLSSSLLLAFVKTCSTSHSQKLYPASLLPFPNNLMDVSGTGLIRREEGCPVTQRHKCSSSLDTTTCSKEMGRVTRRLKYSFYWGEQERNHAFVYFHFWCRRQVAGSLTCRMAQVRHYPTELFMKLQWAVGSSKQPCRARSPSAGLCPPGVGFTKVLSVMRRSEPLVICSSAFSAPARVLPLLFQLSQLFL